MLIKFNVFFMIINFNQKSSDNNWTMKHSENLKLVRPLVCLSSLLKRYFRIYPPQHSRDHKSSIPKLAMSSLCPTLHSLVVLLLLVAIVYFWKGEQSLPITSLLALEACLCIFVCKMLIRK